MGSSTIEKLLERCPDLRNLNPDGLPSIGKPLSYDSFSADLLPLKKMYDIYGHSASFIVDDLPLPPTEKIRLGGGSPGNFPIFPLIPKAILNKLSTHKMNEYPMAAGDEHARIDVADYMNSIGFKGVTKSNIIFTSGSTQGFEFVLKLIVSKGDAVIIPAPNYGLFSFIPERVGAEVKFIDLSPEDDWLINPGKLAKMLDNCPNARVFVNTNPHNPMGKVMGKDNIDLLIKIHKICSDRGVFIIDDLTYRDLCFDQNNMAVPVGTLPDAFSSTISLFSLSKSYHAASLRSGAIVADERIIGGIRNHIFQTIDSVSVDTCAAFAGAYNNSLARRKIYKKYFKKILTEYRYRYYLMKAIIDGIDSIKEKKMRDDIIKDICKYAKKPPTDYDGIPNIDLISSTLPESGFFAILDFTKMKDKYYYSHKIIDDEELSRFFYCDNNIKFLTGSSIGWPNKNQLVGRVTYAFDRSDLINCFLKLKESAAKVKDVPTKYFGVS